MSVDNNSFEIKENKGTGVSVCVHICTSVCC